MKVTLLLADSAQAVDGKLYVLGGGWSVTGPQPSPSALAIKIEVPWSEANRRHRWQARLENPDGEPVMLPNPEGVSPILIEGEFEVGRPAGLPENTPLDVPLAVNVGPIPLEGGAYTWRFFVDDQSEPDWAARFIVRSA